MMGLGGGYSTARIACNTRVREKLGEEYAFSTTGTPPLPNMPPSLPGFGSAKPLCSKKAFWRGKRLGRHRAAQRDPRVVDERGNTREKRTSLSQPGTSGHYYKGRNS